MGLKQIIGAIIFSGAVALTSCSKYKTGTVEKEYGTITENGIFYSSLGKVVAEADAFIKQKYLIQIKSEKELYSVYIISRSGQEESIDDLASNLKEGDKVLARIEKAGRHFGMQVEETLIER